MQTLPKNFQLSDIENIQELFKPALNTSLVSSSNCLLVFDPDTVYIFFPAPIDVFTTVVSFPVSEIVSYSKYGLAGFKIQLSDGQTLRFSNVGGKMRAGITEAIESRR